MSRYRTHHRERVGVVKERQPASYANRPARIDDAGIELSFTRTVPTAEHAISLCGDHLAVGGDVVGDQGCEARRRGSHRNLERLERRARRFGCGLCSSCAPGSDGGAALDHAAYVYTRVTTLSGSSSPSERMLARTRQCSVRPWLSPDQSCAPTCGRLDCPNDPALGFDQRVVRGRQLQHSVAYRSARGSSGAVQPARSCRQSVCEECANAPAPAVAGAAGRRAPRYSSSSANSCRCCDTVHQTHIGIG